jgi:hypothetical protein
MSTPLLCAYMHIKATFAHTLRACLRGYVCVCVCVFAFVIILCIRVHAMTHLD